MALRVQLNTPIHAPIPPPLRGTRLRVGSLCRCATSPHAVGSHLLHKGAFNSTPVEFIWPRRGQCGKRKKSVKKNAALLHFLGFFSLTLPFGVLRGEQPLSRASRAIGSSGTLFGSFWGSKRNTWRKCPIKNKGPPQGGGPRQRESICKHFSCNFVIVIL